MGVDFVANLGANRLLAGKGVQDCNQLSKYGEDRTSNIVCRGHVRPFRGRQQCVLHVRNGECRANVAVTVHITRPCFGVIRPYHVERLDPVVSTERDVISLARRNMKDGLLRSQDYARDPAPTVRRVTLKAIRRGKEGERQVANVLQDG